MKILAPKKAIKRLFNSLPDAGFYQYKSLQTHGRFCNFRNPRRFSEKIFHRMRYPEPVFTTLADKVAVREYVARRVGPEYVVPAYLICDRVTPDTFDALPASFVMKTSNGFGQIRIVRDKSQEDPAQLAALANGWLAEGAATRSREKHYLAIPPRILFEKPLLEGGNAPDDYKFNVFNAPGRECFVFIQHMHGRFRDLEQQLYLEDWSPAPFEMDLPLLRPSTGTTEKPPALAEMLALAKKLAQPFGYLRVDFYLHQGKVYVGELTVTPGAGTYVFTPKHWDRSLGDRFGWPEDLSAAGAQPAARARPSAKPETTRS
ncbi:ATP-grasp fold amidoligase family protein [Frateuria sp. GZRR33]|uniref:ATP-grasp fold amidoligase family protein n=1 Tax=Frateuria sp. GZRR33 TaxID=3351535 RepID=UPI003EDCAF46